jgi:para-nitrobenzyl esterase
MPVVETSAGKVRGSAGPEGAVFLGIPYAAPPVGGRRYAGPAPAEPWRGELKATAFAPPMPQAERRLAGINTRSFIGPRWADEDPELALNIWTPGIDGSYPVMVYIHGGAFLAGSPNAELYHGPAFARDGVVLVTINYRLGLEGFLALDGGETNVGLRDQLAALRWVREEIAAFGGDPGNVTAFGQSAGAMSLGFLMGSHHFDGLADRVISQSGGLGITHTPEQHRIVTEHVAQLLGVPPTREAFAEIPIAEVIDAQAKLVPGSVSIPGDPAGGMLVLLPVRDGELIPHELETVSEIPLLVGDTTEEGNLYVMGLPDPDPAAAAALTQRIFHQPTAALVHAHPGPTWRYRFAWRSGALGGRLGAAHAVDLPFVFDTLDADDLRGDDGLLGREGGSPELAARIHSAWIRFAREGDPGWDQGELHVFP